MKLIVVSLVLFLAFTVYADKCAAECSFDFVKGDTTYFFDPKPICTGLSGDLVYNDTAKGHLYYVMPCGHTTQDCLPQTPSGYTSPKPNGPGIQFVDGNWPPCKTPEDKKCTDPDTGLAVCCTPSCETLSNDTFQVRLIDPADPTVGFMFDYQGISALGHLYDCWGFENGDKKEGHRYLTTVMYCDENENPGRVVFANETETCNYQITIRSIHACPLNLHKTHWSGGWVFILTLFIASIVAFLGVFLIDMFVLKKKQIPCGNFCKFFFGLVADGFFSVFSCLKRDTTQVVDHTVSYSTANEL